MMMHMGENVQKSQSCGRSSFIIAWTIKRNRKKRILIYC